VDCAQILIADESAYELEVTATVLREAGYQVVCCDGSRPALAVLNDGHAIDLLLTDVAMAEIDGFELARRAKALRPTLLVAYLAGCVPASSSGALGPFLRKPYRPANLVRFVEDVLAVTEDARLVRAVASDMIRRSADAYDRAAEEGGLARLKGDDLSAGAWQDIAEAILLLENSPTGLGDHNQLRNGRPVRPRRGRLAMRSR
jgi:two-component system, cell cycle response regulator CpdR